MKLEDFLREQEAASFEVLGVIEAVPERPTRVRLTLYRSGQGCSCSGAIELSSEDIEDVEPTSNSTWCCGKQRRIARIKIKSTAHLPIGDVLARSLSRIEDPMRPPPDGPDSDPCYYCNEA